MKYLNLCFALILVISTTGFSQSDQKSVVIGQMVTKANAILILNPPGSDQGFLLPQLSSTDRQRMAPTSPAEDGLLVFDSTEKSFYYWKSGQWVKGLGDESEPLTFDPVTNTLSSNGSSVNLTSLKEIPVQSSSDAGKFLTTNGTVVSWATLSNLGDITTVLAGVGLSGGAAAGDARLDVKTDNATISVNGSNQLQLSDLAVTPIKIKDGAVTSAKLNTTGVAAGLYGNNAQVAQINVDAQGRITNATNVTIAGATPTGAAGGDLVGSTYPNPIVAANAITSAKILDGAITSADITNGAITGIKLANTAVTPSTYGTSTQVPQFTVDAQGRITNALNVTISGVAPAGAAGGDLTGTYPSPTVTSNAIGSAEISDNTITSADLTDGTIANADINAGAAIAVNKLATGTDGQVLSVVATVPTWTTVPGLTPQTSYYSVDPSDFQMLKSDGKPDKSGMAIFETNDAFATASRDNEGETIMTSLHLPHGATMTQMIIYYWDNAPENITVSLMRKNLTTGVNAVLNTFTTSLASATIRTQTIAAFGGMEVIANDLYSYRILVNFDIVGPVDNPAQAKQRIYGVRMEYLH